MGIWCYWQVTQPLSCVLSVEGHRLTPLYLPRYTALDHARASQLEFIVCTAGSWSNTLQYVRFFLALDAALTERAEKLWCWSRSSSGICRQDTPAPVQVQPNFLPPPTLSPNLLTPRHHEIS